MRKSLYISVWFLLILAVSVTILTIPVNRPLLVVLALVTLGPVYALALWLVITGTGKTNTG